MKMDLPTFSIGSRPSRSAIASRSVRHRVSMVGGLALPRRFGDGKVGNEKMWRLVVHQGVLSRIARRVPLFIQNGSGRAASLDLRGVRDPTVPK